jgi:AcrR family transcriptional regulator
MKQTPVRAPFKPVEFNPATPPNRRALSKLRTRLKVLEAARDLFIERGYEAATVRDIARRAGMSTGAVFANFEDKSDLFETIVREDLEQVAEAMRAAALGSHGPLVEKLTQTFAAGYAFHMKSLPLVQATIAYSWQRPLEAELRGREALKGLLSIIGDVLKEAARRGEVRQDFDVRLVSEMLWDTSLANFRRAVYDGWTLESLGSRLADQIEVVLRGLRA